MRCSISIKSLALSSIAFAKPYHAMRFVFRDKAHGIDTKKNDEPVDADGLKVER